MTPIQRAYQNAIDAQDACNLSGLVHSLHRDMTAIWEEVRAAGGGTQEVNTHPIVRMYMNQLLWLSYRESPPYSQYADAQKQCEAKTQTPTETTP